MTGLSYRRGIGLRDLGVLASLVAVIVLLGCRPAAPTRGPKPANAPSQTRAPSAERSPGTTQKPIRPSTHAESPAAAPPKSQSLDHGVPAPSLRLSTLPKDTMAVAQVRASFTPLQTKLSQALDTPPKSLLRSLPLSALFPLRQLSLLQSPKPPFDQHPAAIVWDPKQRAFWMWNQDDTSLAARHALERSLQATTRFSPPYWIFENPEDSLEYFVHSKAGWLLASPKAWAPAIREWLTDVSRRDIGSLPWAPEPSTAAPLLLRWRAPQLLESATQAPLPVIGTLELDAMSGLRVNGGAREQP